MIISHCSSCGAIFQSRIIKIDNVVNLTLSNIEETCPHCGGVANIAEGVFSATNGMLSIISAPDITQKMYQEFLGLAKKAKNKKLEDSDFISAAKAIDPRLGTVAILATRNKKLATLVFLIIWLKSCVAFDVKLDANQLYDQIFNQSNIEYVLPDEGGGNLNGELRGNDSNPSHGGTKEQEREFKPFLSPRKETLSVSVSPIAILIALNHI